MAAGDGGAPKPPRPRSLLHTWIFSPVAVFTSDLAAECDIEDIFSFSDPIAELAACMSFAEDSPEVACSCMLFDILQSRSLIASAIDVENEGSEARDDSVLK